MRKKWVAGGLACLCAILTGCQLAQEDAGAQNDGDRLVGVLVTKEYLDLADWEAYFNAHPQQLLSGGQIDAPQGRLYAALVPRTLTNEETGQTVAHWQYVFEDVDGIAYLAANIMPPDAASQQDGYIASNSDDAISDGQMNLYYGDTEEKISLEGTIYVGADSVGQTCYINPVYQSPDGSVYAESGSGFSVQGVTDEGSAYSQTLEESTTVTQNGVCKTVSTQEKITIGVMFAPEKIMVRQMDADSAVIDVKSYVPGDMPEQIRPLDDAAYLIVETHKQNRAGELLVQRALYGPDDASFKTYRLRDDGICAAQYTQLDWRE